MIPALLGNVGANNTSIHHPHLVLLRVHVSCLLHRHQLKLATVRLDCVPFTSPTCQLPFPIAKPAAEHGASIKCER
jgi:hypothetical protein